MKSRRELPVVTMKMKTIILHYVGEVGEAYLVSYTRTTINILLNKTFQICDQSLMELLSYFPSFYYQKTFLLRNKAHTYTSKLLFWTGLLRKHLTILLQYCLQVNFLFVLMVIFDGFTFLLSPHLFCFILTVSHLVELGFTCTQWHYR